MNLTRLLILTCVVMLAGCSAQKDEGAIGFLSDYSNLESDGPRSYVYIAEHGAIARYHKFIIDPIQVHYQSDRGWATRAEFNNLAISFRGSLAEAVADRYEVVALPGPGTAQVRLAVTDLRRSPWWTTSRNSVARRIQNRRGRAALEGEILDTETGKQIAAFVQLQSDEFQLDTIEAYEEFHEWVRNWSKRFRIRLDEAHDNFGANAAQSSNR